MEEVQYIENNAIRYTENKLVEDKYFYIEANSSCNGRKF
jgi:hypothetical protein